MRAILFISMTLLSTPVLAKPVCQIITSDDMTVFNHELAHCNGWEHDSENIPTDPPLQYVHRFKGQLIVTISDGSYGYIVGWFAQKGTRFRYSIETAHALCIDILTRYNYYIPSDMMNGTRRIGGCAVPEE